MVYLELTWRLANQGGKRSVHETLAVGYWAPMFSLGLLLLNPEILVHKFVLFIGTQPR